MNKYTAIALVGNFNKETNKADLFETNEGTKEYITMTAESEKSASAALGRLLGDVNNYLAGNSQFKNPVIVVNGVRMSPTSAKKMRLDFAKFRLEFAIIRTEIETAVAFTSKEAGEQFIRETDRNGIFSKTKSFSQEQVAAQVVEQRRLVKDLVKWAKDDAKASVLTPEVEQRRIAATEFSKQKRLAAKAAAAKIAAQIKAAAAEKAEAAQ